MINHVRTLLLNRSAGSTGFGQQPGDEFVPPKFAEISLPGFLTEIRNQLFGTDPDIVMLNYRLRQYMGLLHNSELEEFVLGFDPRVTYELLPVDELFQDLFVTTVVGLGGTAKQFFPQGQVGAPDKRGRTQHQWLVRVVSSNSVTVIRHTKPASEASQAYTLTSGLSSLIELTGSGLTARFHEGVGSEWLITAVARPATDLGVVLANLDALGEPTFLQLFGVGDKTATEPFKTLYNLWRDHPELPYRLGAVLVAYAHQADDLR